jgi:hypothetical protein
MAFVVPSSYITALDNNGNIVPGARCYFYLANTTTQKVVYADAALSIPLPAPSGYIVADPFGRFAVGYIADGDTVKFVIRSADGATTFITVDNVQAPVGVASASAVLRPYQTRSANFTVDQTMNGGVIGVDASAGSVNVGLDTSVLGTFANGLWVTIVKIDTSQNLVTLTPGSGQSIDSAAGNYSIDTPQESLTVTAIGAAGWRSTARTSVEPLGELPVLNAQIGVSYVLAATDKGGKVTMTNASANALHIPPNNVVPFPLLTRIEVTQGGAGQTSLVADGATLIFSFGSPTANAGWLKLAGQNAGIILTKFAVNSWYAEGSLTA